MNSAAELASNITNEMYVNIVSLKKQYKHRANASACHGLGVKSVAAILSFW
jgi:hypothetical protein